MVAQSSALQIRQRAIEREALCIQMARHGAGRRFDGGQPHAETGERVVRRRHAV
jgi:hypothetical protein